jgi:diaminohydroxyphosphoribosylaminopyrimidine deaminase/5-amino-6-(5-phosphoribosylamino)uracil reductase
MNDPKYLTLCLQEAQKARLACPPNPAVGCVLVDPQGGILGVGHTQPVGGAHAEVMALRDAARQGHATAGCTAWVTLEPCSHQGRTGPCCDALIQAGVTRVVASMEDPNPLVAGQGFARLQAAGVAVEVGPGAQAAFELNIGFFSRMKRKRPWVRMKLAASLDGTTALPNGNSQWITGTQARSDGHLWRARACAILTGVGTVLQDDPLLNVRGLDTPRQPALMLLDSQLQTPPTARLFSVPRAVTVFAAVDNAARRQALEAAGALVVVLPGSAKRADKVDLDAFMNHVGSLDINELHVEAGAKLNGSLLAGRCVDELLLYLAPRLLGPGASLAALPELTNLDAGQALQFHDVQRAGEDLRLLVRFAGADRFLHA